MLNGFLQVIKPQRNNVLEHPSNIPLVLMVANLAPHKGQETAIRAMAILKRAGVDSHLLARWGGEAG